MARSTFWPTQGRWQRTLHAVGIDDTETPESRAFLRRQIKQAARTKAFIDKHRPLFESLTPREREILALVASGNDNPAIARELYISRRTVEQHRKNINTKLRTNKLHVLIEYGRAFGLI